VTAQLFATIGALPASAVSALVAAGVSLLVIVTLLFVNRRQRRMLERLDERLTHLHAGLTLLTNTTEDGFRGLALHLAHLAGAAETKPPAMVSTRQRISVAAGHGRSVQDIAATEQVSEGEVLLHLLLDKLKPEGANAEVC
jgi:hypothetical protein